jgi:hypothetical protein
MHQSISEMYQVMWCLVFVLDIKVAYYVWLSFSAIEEKTLLYYY